MFRLERCLIVMFSGSCLRIMITMLEKRKVVVFLWPVACVLSLIQYNINGSNTNGSFTVDDSNSFFSPYKILPIAQENKYLMIFFLFYHGIVCCVYLLESPHRSDSNEYTQHTIIM